MAQEIERKWLSTNKLISKLLESKYFTTKYISQYYLPSKEENKEERVRRIDFSLNKSKFFHTIKKGYGLSREEIENEISEEEFYKLLKNATSGITKTRLEFDGYEIDKYEFGLCTIEKEYSSEEEAFSDLNEDIIPFMIKEITGDKSFSNKILSEKFQTESI